MGYCISLEIDNMLIPKENEQKALDAINALMAKKNKTFGAHYSWVNPPAGGSFKSLVEALDEWRYHAVDSTDGIVIDYFNGEKLGDCAVLWTALQELVNPEGEIYCTGEDGDKWKWTFKDGKFKETRGRIVWDD
jgi:hypothetical protein